MKKSLIGIAIVLLFAPFLAAVEEENLIEDGTFESGALPDIYDGKESVSLKIVKGNPLPSDPTFKGKQCLEIKQTGSGKVRIILGMAKKIYLDPFKNYRWTIKVYCMDEANATFGCYAQNIESASKPLESGGKVWECALTTTGHQTEWETLESTVGRQDSESHFKTLPNMEWISMTLWLTLDPGSVFYIGEMKIVEIPLSKKKK